MKAVHHLWLGSHENDKQIMLIAHIQNMQIIFIPHEVFFNMALVAKQVGSFSYKLPMHYFTFHSKVLFFSPK